MVCRVVNRRTHTAADGEEEVYIGRARGVPGEWGNEFVMGRDGTRDDVCEKHRRAVLNSRSRLQAVADKLRGKPRLALICWCAPERCHGDTLCELVLMSDSKFAAIRSEACNS